MPENEPFIGRTLAGRFRVTGYIGEGGMASVYRGVQDGDGRNVAIKVMNADLSKDRKFVRRFRREAKAASMLKHANTVEILEFGVDGETVYLAMECIEGLDLAMVLERDRRLTERRAASVVMQVCSALAVAHAQNIVHRDLKPDNIMITANPREKGAELVKVLDFGIAKILDEDEGPMPDPRAEPQSHAPSLLTRVGTIVGTPAYMSPEQGRAEKVDGRTDIYACGVLLYELVTGRTPFGGETPMQVVMRHVNEPPIPPSQYVEIHPKLEAIILKALMKWPAERQQSAAELARALEAILPELATAKRPLVSSSTGGSPSVVIADRAPPTVGSGPNTAPMASAAASAIASTDRAGAGPTSAASTTRGAPPPTGPATPANPPADDDEPSTLIVADVANVTGAKGPTATPAAGDKKLVFPTLNIDLPEDLEKAGVSRPGAAGVAKSPTLTSPAAPAAPARTATPPSPSVPAATASRPSDEDDDARTLVAQPRPPTGQGPRIEVGPGGSLGLAQTLASELGDVELPRAPTPAAGAPAPKPAAAQDEGGRDRLSTPGPGQGRSDIGSDPTEAGDRPSSPKLDGKTSDDRLGLGATLPLDPAELDRVLAAAPAARAPLGSMSEVSSPGAASAEVGASSAIAPARKGLSVAMAMVLGAVIGAVVVGAIVVALVSMR